jgi:hypothetical protein
VAAGGHPQLQAATGQGGLHGLLGAHLADHGRGLLAAHQARLQGDDVPAWLAMRLSVVACLPPAG